MGLATKQQSPTLNINKRQSFGVISELSHDRWIMLDSFHHGPDNLFFDQNTPLTLDMHWPSLHAVYSPRAYRMPHLPAVARHTASPAIKKPTSRQSKYSHAQGIYQLFSHHPKVAGTTELWNGPLKTHERTVLCRAGWDKVFHKATHTPNQRCSFLKARLHRSRSQGVGKGVAPFITTRCGSLAKFAASAHGLCSAGQEILLSKGKMFPLEGRTTASLSWKLRPPVAILELSYL